MDLYAENILDHYRHPRNKSDLRSNSDQGIQNTAYKILHTEANHSCGDELTIGLKIEDGTITDIQWNGTGCAISQAAISMLSEEVEKIKTEDALKLSQGDVYELLGVPIGPRRIKCALLGLHTLKNALRKEKGLEPQSWLETVDLS